MDFEQISYPQPQLRAITEERRKPPWGAIAGTLEAWPGITRARELFLLGRRVDATREWRWVMELLSVPEKTQAVMLAASWVHRIIGESGASVVSRVMGLILASVATTNALTGFREYFSL